MPLTEPRGPRVATADATRLRELLALALRASAGRHADAARDVVLTILLAHLLADAGHDGTPQATPRAPRRGKAPRSHHAHRSALSGRRPRG
jgi:hypothetical protein